MIAVICSDNRGPSKVQMDPVPNDLPPLIFSPNGEATLVRRPFASVVWNTLRVDWPIQNIVWPAMIDNDESPFLAAVSIWTTIRESTSDTQVFVTRFFMSGDQLLRHDVSTSCFGDSMPAPRCTLTCEPNTPACYRARDSELRYIWPPSLFNLVHQKIGCRVTLPAELTRMTEDIELSAVDIRHGRLYVSLDTSKSVSPSGKHNALYYLQF